ncbi:hypothetical protein L210DRAFT_3389413 [Boletus edulis BED1]|uniref:PQ-loop repeat-containing protein 1 n=1 Tax=Boletus edulis BED1 TaxID=1328754 RepID=A0AAD4GK82_BOLED|nr:hypothetical protein L210DRAFT_3389413 [Boletus edulis BED1]
MIPSWITAIGSVAMAIGPPLVYADQGVSIVRKKDSTGFSRDICAILLIANITRCFFWLGAGFEFALLLQSIFMIVAQLALLFVCLHYRPRVTPGSYAPSPRPFSFWQWSSYTQYIECLASIILCSAITFLIFGRFEFYISLSGFFALGLESTLPLPQLISNYKHKSLYGFRASTMIGWVGGDAFKTAYFFLQGSPLQFKACAIFQLSVDAMIVAQRLYYGNTPPAPVLEGEGVEEVLVLSEA